MATDPPAGGSPYRSARTLRAGDLDAVFLPGHGMLGASLRHRGTEILGRVANLEAAAARGSTAGIPLLHPWANRLAGFRYRVGGHEVTLDRSSPLLHLDEHGLSIHGVPWSQLPWEVTEATPDHLAARFDWARGFLAVFPYPHRLELRATLRPDGLTLETSLRAGPEGPVPVSFGFHPYFAIPGLPRSRWRLELPAMRRLVLDARAIPTGEEVAFGGFDAELGERELDDGFALLEEPTRLSVAGGGLRITVELLTGYPYAQVFAPKGKDYVALEPMTAPTSALTSGRGLRLVEAGREFQAAFRISVNRVEPLGPARGAGRSPAGG